MGHAQCGRNLLTHLSNPSKLRNYAFLPSLFAAHGVRFRKLEVILTTPVDNLGKAGEVVKVAPGYFRNYLMPKLFAVPNIHRFANLINKQQKLDEPQQVESVLVIPRTEEDAMKEYQTAAKRLDKARLVLRRLISKDNELRVPVTKDEIVSEVARQLCVCIQPENLYLPADLMTVGEFEIPLRLPRSIPMPEGKVGWSLKLKIRRK